MIVVIELTKEQRKHHDLLILGIREGYLYLDKRLQELGDLDLYDSFADAFATAPNDVDQAAVIQEYRRKLEGKAL